MLRIQARLRSDQAEAVRRLAAGRGVPMAEIVRRSVDAFIADTEGRTEDDLRRRALSAVGSLSGGPRDLAGRHDEYAAEAFES